MANEKRQALNTAVGILSVTMLLSALFLSMFGFFEKINMHKLNFFVPESHLDIVKKAVFGVGAGRIGDYDQCCWQTLGTGQYRPLAGSNPYLGQQGKVERVSEYRVELVCEDHLVRAAVRALIDAHPYEEPAYDVVRLDNPLL